MVDVPASEVGNDQCTPKPTLFPKQPLGDCWEMICSAQKHLRALRYPLEGKQETVEYRASSRNVNCSQCEKTEEPGAFSTDDSNARKLGSRRDRLIVWLIVLNLLPSSHCQNTLC